MGKFYIFGIIVFIVSLMMLKLYVSDQFWGEYYFLTMAVVGIYIGLFFGTLISFLDEFFPNSRISKFIKKIYAKILDGMQSM